MNIAEGKELLAKVKAAKGFVALTDALQPWHVWCSNNAADLFAAIERKDALIRKAAEALRPFEREAAEYGDMAEDGEHPRLEWGAGTTIYTVGDLRRARAIAEECEKELKG